MGEATKRRSGRSGSPGFTLVELLCGLSVTAVVMAAMAGVVLAVSASWREHDPQRPTQFQADQSARRLETVIRPARLVGHVNPGSLAAGAPGSAAMLFWAEDANGDGLIQLSELMLIKHDRSSRTLLAYQVVYPSNMTELQKQMLDLTVTAEALAEAGAIESFRTMSYVTSRPLTRNVSGMRLLVQAGTYERPPLVEFALRLEGGGGEATAYGSAALRAAVKEPS